MQKAIVAAILAVVLLLSGLLLGLNPTSVPDLEGLLLAGSDDPAALPVGNFSADTPSGKLRLAFSETEHFYDDDVRIAITASLRDAEIYYTTDGSEPTAESTPYTEPLSFTASRDVKAVVLKAVAILDDTVTRPLTHTYFLGHDIDKRFDTPVFSLSTDADGLYNYETGIFVEGRLRDEYKAANPNDRNPDPNKAANFNVKGREAERLVYVETFEPDGTRVVAQAAGLRVNGGWSRADTPQKSLRLIARNEYEPGYGKFKYEFFPGETVNDEYGMPLGKYDTIVLRNGANDRNEAMLRNEVSSSLARQAGFREVSPARACAVFLNGEYYGFAWIQVRLEETYLKDIYGTPAKDFDIVGRGEEWLDSDNRAAVAALENLNGYGKKNLTNNAIFAELEEILDIDNFLWYYAYQIYLGNNDWPNNNIKRWRYTGPEFYGMAPELDGRWRYLMYDLDWTLGLYGNLPTMPTFQNVLGGHKSSPLLIAVLKRPDMAEKFTMMMCDIMYTLVTPENVTDAISALYNEAGRELSKAIASNKYAYWASEYTVEEHHSRMISYAKERGKYIQSSLAGYFRYTDEMFDVNVSGGAAMLGTLVSDHSRYFTALTVPVRPALGKFEVFDHWMLNGKRIDTPEITVSVNDATDGTVSLELVTREELPALIISETYTGKRNGCVLTNTTDQPVSTAGLFMSDTAENPWRWEIPAATVPAGGTLVLAGKGSSDAKDLLSIQMGFNVKIGGLLTLSGEGGAVWDYATMEY